MQEILYVIFVIDSERVAASMPVFQLVGGVKAQAELFDRGRLIGRVFRRIIVEATLFDLANHRI